MSAIKREEPSFTIQYRLRTRLKNGDHTQLTQELMNLNPLIIAQHLRQINLNLSIDMWLLLQSFNNFLIAVKQDDLLNRNVRKNILLFLLFSQNPKEEYQQFSRLIAAAFYMGEINDVPSTLFDFIDKVLPENIITFRLVGPDSLVNFLFHASKANNFKVSRSTFTLFEDANLLQGLSSDRGFIGDCFKRNTKITIMMPSLFGIKIEEENAAFLDVAMQRVDIVVKKDGSLSDNLMLILVEHPQVALRILDEKIFEPFITRHIDVIAAKHISFAAKVLKLLSVRRLPCIPERHEARAYAMIPTSKLVSLVNGAASIKKISLWQRARLFLDAQQGNDEYLTLFVDSIEKDSPETVLVNPLYLLAYEAGNLAAGIKLAHNLFNGNDILPNEERALEIYTEIASEHPELLTPAAVTCVVEPLLFQVQTCWKEFTDMLIEDQSASRKQESKKEKSKRFNILQQTFATHQRRFFQYIEIVEDQSPKLSEKDIVSKANNALACLYKIIDFNFDKLRQFKDHFSLQTAHAIMVKFLVEQRDNYQGNDWRGDLKRSLKFAWNYDVHPDCDPYIGVYILNIKKMPGDLRGILDEIEREIDEESRLEEGEVLGV